MTTENVIEPERHADYEAVWTASDEWYPYYFVVPSEDRNREDECLLSPAELEFVREADRVFRTAQRYIEEGHKRFQAARVHEAPSECPECLGFGYLMEHDGIGGTFKCPTCTALIDGSGGAE